MISYLEVNTENPRDNKSVSTILENLPAAYHKDIYSIDYIYQKTSNICVVIFAINTILSGITVYKYNYGNQTTTTFITNVLFMITKVYSTYYIANTEKSIFYSAYLYDRVQYNDIDPNIKTDIEKGVSKNELTHPQKYAQLREPDELLTHEIKEQLLDEDVTKELYQGDSIDHEDEDDDDFSLGFPLELPRENSQIELDIEFPVDTFIDLPDEVGEEDINKEVVDLLRQSVKEVLAEMRKNMELQSKESLVD
jgi:hypothetical protein